MNSRITFFIDFVQNCGVRPVNCT